MRGNNVQLGQLCSSWLFGRVHVQLALIGTLTTVQGLPTCHHKHHGCFPRDGRSASATSRRVHISVVCGCSRDKQATGTWPSSITVLLLRYSWYSVHSSPFSLICFISQIYIYIIFPQCPHRAFSNFYVSVVWRFCITSHSYRHFDATSDIYIFTETEP